MSKYGLIKIGLAAVMPASTSAVSEAGDLESATSMKPRRPGWGFLLKIDIGIW